MQGLSSEDEDDERRAGKMMCKGGNDGEGLTYGQTEKQAYEMGMGMGKRLHKQHKEGASPCAYELNKAIWRQRQIFDGSLSASKGILCAGGM